MKKTAGLDVKEFCRQVVFGEVITIMILVGSCILVSALLPSSIIRLIVSFSLPNVLFLASIWFWGLDNHEREIIKSMVIKLCKR